MKLVNWLLYEEINKRDKKGKEWLNNCQLIRVLLNLLSVKFSICSLFSVLQALSDISQSSTVISLKVGHYYLG